MLVAALVGVFLSAGPAMAGTEIAPRSADDLQEEASDIVLATVINRSVTEMPDGDWLDRRFSFTIQIEDVLKGSLVRGDLIENVKAWNRAWTSSTPPPPSGSGHRPLPLEGEVAKFYLEPAEDGSLAILLPNGVELSSRADPTDPVRTGEPAPSSIPKEEAEDAIVVEAKDPFGWDVMLVLLAIPILVGAFKQPGAARWMLLGISGLMLGGAVVIILLR
ncbi:MAG: hypothetical protein QMB94_00160 [Phycisphaerales bacterium]